MGGIKKNGEFSMHYDEDDEEYSDLDLDFEDAVERGYEDDKDRDDDRFKFGSTGSFSGRSGPSGPSAGAGCLIMMGLVGSAFASLASAWVL